MLDKKETNIAKNEYGVAIGKVKGKVTIKNSGNKTEKSNFLDLLASITNWIIGFFNKC